MRSNHKKINFDTLVLIFVIGSVVGTYYEQILTAITSLIKHGNFLWESRRGVIYGPLNPLYGFALTVFTYLFCKEEKRRKPWQIFILTSILGGGIEYTVSLIQEIFIGKVSWNYKNKFLNINGRTTIPFMLFWGFCACLYIYQIYPILKKQIEKIPQKTKKLLVYFFTIFLSLDMLISFGALFRQGLRNKNIEPISKVGEFFDTYYNDNFLEKYYPNMKPKEKEKK